MSDIVLMFSDEGLKTILAGGDSVEPDIVRRSVEGLRNWSAARWREYGLRLVLELLVVFIGVYGASAFADYQRTRELEARRGRSGAH